MKKKTLKHLVLFSLVHDSQRALATDQSVYSAGLGYQVTLIQTHFWSPPSLW